jgi:hypothetical protein
MIGEHYFTSTDLLPTQAKSKITRMAHTLRSSSQPLGRSWVEFSVGRVRPKTGPNGLKNRDVFFAEGGAMVFFA